MYKVMIYIYKRCNEKQLKFFENKYKTFVRMI